ncbi:hypothetical protein AXF42_Ash001813 [Apostasia shenzhenica]|uniref:VQ domain-containing protein n=1 Tax=Apostasia shenzhenica TaxID=1088818 RepID=A0A2I0ABB2_9ASPA|nr:hypothetical protein AXF42_Ash001813 [Apostasia shenzhenica]
MESSTPATNALRSDSHAVSKPKVRVIHIFAPEIIKTEPANFRELVQRLTGKPREKKSRAAGGRRRRKTTKITTTAAPAPPPGAPPAEQKTAGRFQCLERVLTDQEDDEEGDVDGFFQGLGDLPLMPILSSARMDVIG